jgi:hypothetical protein
MKKLRKRRHSAPDFPNPNLLLSPSFTNSLPKMILSDQPKEKKDIQSAMTGQKQAGQQNYLC